MVNPVLTCTAYDTATQTCTAQAWMVHPSVLPPLTVEQGIEIGWKIALCFAIAYGLKVARQMTWRG